MKRLHVHVGVDDLTQSIGFYSILFGAEPGLDVLDQPLREDFTKKDGEVVRAHG